MVPEMFNAETAVTESFQAGIQYLVDRYGLTEQDAKELYGKPDPDAIYDQYHEFDLSKASPWISLPGNPKNTVPLSSMTNQPKIDKAFLASCTLGLHDLEEAAFVLKNRNVHPRTRLIIIPSSENIMNQSEEKGILEILRKSGAEIVYESACGPCIGEGLGSVVDNETAISATNRNFPGRMGSKNADVYLGGTYLTALSAIYGHIPTAEEYKISMEEIQKESLL
jgi:3-isopropylmalate/(R)-2-methylmalate dehydratase large subunit